MSISNVQTGLYSQANSSDLYDWEEGEDSVKVTLARDGEGFGNGSGDGGVDFGGRAAILQHEL